MSAFLSTLARAYCLLLVQVNREDVEVGRRGVNQYSITLDGELKHHDTRALIKTCETLAFLVRDAAHVTPHNFESCVHAIRTFVEASIHGGESFPPKGVTPTSLLVTRVIGVTEFCSQV